MITNPTDIQLKYWYCCKKNVAWYLMKYIPVIHYKEGKYYFERTEELSQLIEGISFKLKFLDIFEK